VVVFAGGTKTGTLRIIRLLKLTCPSEGRWHFICCAKDLTKNSFQEILAFTE
jgi:hypothetical protein